MLPLLGVNNCLPLFHKNKIFIWLEETKECINEFLIGYMINPNLNMNKPFRKKLDKCINTTLVSKKENKSIIIINVLWNKKKN